MTVSRHNTIRYGLPAVAIAIVTLILPGLLPTASAGSGHYIPIPAAQQTLAPAADMSAEAVLAGGCFWGMEMVFQHVKGVRKVVSGYAGGSKATAHYAAASSGRTRHAESVHIFYDPRKINYSELLRIYFSIAHDPMQRNRQGPDAGPQYRSEIFALNVAQKRVAEAYIRQLDAAGAYARPIATQVAVIRPNQFYPAERYHQNYGMEHPRSLYIRMYDQPKLRSLAAHFPAYYVDASQIAGERP